MPLVEQRLRARWAPPPALSYPLVYVQRSCGSRDLSFSGAQVFHRHRHGRNRPSTPYKGAWFCTAAMTTSSTWRGNSSAVPPSAFVLRRLRMSAAMAPRPPGTQPRPREGLASLQSRRQACPMNLGDAQQRVVLIGCVKRCEHHVMRHVMHRGRNVVGIVSPRHRYQHLVRQAL